MRPCPDSRPCEPGQKLNGVKRPALPRPPAYFAITSDFEIDLVDDSRGLPRRVAMSLFGQVADRMLHRTGNDLVVANDSTLSFHTAGPMANEASSLQPEANGRVHHRCFMVAEEVVEHLMTCLPTQSQPEGFLGPSSARKIEAKAPDEVSLGHDCDVSVIVRGTPLGGGTQAGVAPSQPLRVEAIVSHGFDSLAEAACI